MKLITVQKSHSHLATFTSMQHCITTLSSATMIWTSLISYQHFSWHGKPQHGQHVIIRLSHMETLEGPTGMRHSFTICPAYHQFQLPSSTNIWSVASNLCPLYITYWVNRWYRITLDTIFSQRSLCNGYRIVYNRIGDILLLLLLVSTCQISMLTFTTRFYVIYYCGWLCRGSTLLQIQGQGQTAYKTSWESWPAYWMRTYMDGELTEATGTVIRSSCIWIIA